MKHQQRASGPPSVAGQHQSEKRWAMPLVRGYCRARSFSRTRGSLTYQLGLQHSRRSRRLCPGRDISTIRSLNPWITGDTVTLGLESAIYSRLIQYDLRAQTLTA